jgi:hypothetical protein
LSPETVHEELAAINSAIERPQETTASYLVLDDDYYKFEDELGQQEYVPGKRMTKLKNALDKQATSLVQQTRRIIELEFDYFTTPEVG